MDRKTVLSLPLIFWNRTGADLEHSITAMAVHGECLATGSQTGDIVMWIVKDLVCTPLIFATPRLGMECRQLAFIKPPYEAALGVSLWVASLHDDNRIRVWDWEDGRCVSISETSLLQPIPRVTLMRAIQGRLLAVGGEGCVLHIVDSWSLTKISSCRLPAHLIDISVQNFGVGTRLVALCGEDQILLWELSDVSNYLIDIEAPRPIDPRPTLKLTMRTSEPPHKIALSTDCSLLAVAYESIISFVHEEWVRYKQFTLESRDEAYMCMSGPVVEMIFTEESFVVVLESGLLVEYSIEEILEKVEVGKNKPEVRARTRHRLSTIFRLPADAESVVSILLSDLNPNLSRHKPKEDLESQPSHYAIDLSPSPGIASLTGLTKCIAFNEDYLILAKEGVLYVCEVDCISSGIDFYPSKLTLSAYKPHHFADFQLHCLLDTDETITDSHLVMAHSWPLYVVGTSKGRVFVVPLAAAHAIRCLEAGTTDAVTCLLYYRSSLVSCSAGGNIQIWSLSMSELKRTPETENFRSSSMSSDSGQPITTEQHLPIKTFRIPYQNMRILKQPHSLHEVVEGMNDGQWFEKWRYWQMLLVGQMEDETVVLISLERGNVLCAFYGVKGRVRDVHIHLPLDYLFLSCSNGDCYIFNMVSQQLERILPSASLPFKSFSRPPAHSFQEDPDEAKSLPHHLLEFNIIGMTAHHSQALAWVEYPVLGDAQFPVLCLNIGKIMDSFEEMAEFPEQAEFIISLMNCWVRGQSEDEDKMQEHLRVLFRVHEPSVIANVGVFGMEGAISFRLPGDCSRWGISPYISALVSACLYSVLNACVHFRPALQPLFDISVKTHITRLSHRVNNFHCPSLLVFAIEVLNGNTIAYELMRSSLEHFSVEERKDMLKEWLGLYQASMSMYEQNNSSGDLDGSPAPIIGCQSPHRPLKHIGFIEALSTIIVSVLHLSGNLPFGSELELVSTLAWMLQGHKVFFTQAAAMVLRDGMKKWRKAIGKEIFVEMMEAMLSLNYESNFGIRMAAKKALIAMGKADVPTFIEVLKREVTKLAGHRDYPESILHILESFIEKHAPHTLFYLPSLLEVILRSLDPREILLRKICVVRASEALELMVKSYPMIGFEPRHQLIAVGTSSNKIVVYDLKTGVVWKDLEGHRGPVSVVEFNPDGNRMVSYSTSDMMVKLWRVEEGFLGLGGLTIKEYRVFELKPVVALVRSTRALLKTIKAEWHQPHTVLLTREDGETYSLSMA